MKSTEHDQSTSIAHFLLLILAAAFVTLAIMQYQHTCTDSTHQTCDGQCECDGMNCK